MLASWIHARTDVRTNFEDDPLGFQPKDELYALPSFYWLLRVTAGLEMIRGFSATLRVDTKRTWSLGNPWEEIHLFPVVITPG